MSHKLFLDKGDLWGHCWEEELNSLSLTFNLSCLSEMGVQTSPFKNVSHHSKRRMGFFPLPRKLIDLVIDTLVKHRQCGIIQF